jgi:hypothetical protein
MSAQFLQNHESFPVLCNIRDPIRYRNVTIAWFLSAHKYVHEVMPVPVLRLHDCSGPQHGRVHVMHVVWPPQLIMRVVELQLLLPVCVYEIRFFVVRGVLDESMLVALFANLRIVLA